MAGRGAVTAQKAKGVEATLMGKLSGSVLLGPTDEAKLDDFYLRLSLEVYEANRVRVRARGLSLEVCEA